MPDDAISDADLDSLLDQVSADGADRRLHRDLLRTAVGLASDEPSRLDLKIALAALAEMRRAFSTFAPYRDRQKITMFGSARTRPDDPLYAQARGVAERLSEHGWMVVTGAGPGIMAAGMEGAGIENAFGVTIRLPFEESANGFIAGDPKLVDMKYFFTRKLMLVKESAAFVALPGGFGTQDETFELFTLQQTGKTEPAPVVLLDVPGGTYWTAWADFVRTELVARGLVAAEDLNLFLITDDANEAVEEILRFHHNYRSLRWVGDRLVLRLEHAPNHAELADLNEEFADVITSGAISRTEPLKAEVADDDDLGAERLVVRFDRYHMSRLRSLINELNRLPSMEGVRGT